MDLSPALDRPACDMLAELQTVPLPLSTPLASATDGWTRDPASGAELLDLDRLIPDPDQPRRQLDQAELVRLAESVSRHGILQPLRVQWLPDRGVWMLVAGERRLAAAQAAGLTAVPAIRAAAALTEAEALQEQLAENQLRQDLNPIDEGHAYRRLIVLRGWSQRDLAAHCHVTQTGVCRALKLLELDSRVQTLVAEGTVKVSAALELASLPPDRQLAFAQRLAGKEPPAAETSAEPRVIQIESPPLVRLKLPRTVVKIDGGRVTVQAAGDVEARLRDAIRAVRRQRAADVPAAAAAA